MLATHFRRSHYSFDRCDNFRHIPFFVERHMNPQLIGLAGPSKGKAFGLTERDFSIGRDPSNSLSLNDALISRHHLLIRNAGSGFTIVDLNSRNGTFVNAVPVTERKLEPGDRIQVGDSLLLFAVDEENPAIPPGPVRFDETAVVGQPTAQLRKDDSLYLNPLKAPAVTDRMARDLKTLLRISTEISSIRGPEALQRHLLELIFDSVPADHGAILIFDTDSRDILSSFSWSRQSGAHAHVAVARSVIDGVIRERAAVLSDATQSLLVAPLLVLDKLIGVIYLESTATRFDEGHLQLLVGIAGMASGALENTRRLESLEVENRRLRSDINLQHDMIGESARMREVYQFVAKAAPANSTVLIRGESGTGKELVARAIHLNSSRSQSPFVAINCAVLSETLLESELFGHEKGAFTGAIAQKKGKLEVANGGTVFLDELAELAPTLQAKLLRVLQEREFERVGGTRAIKVDIRLIAATNQDLDKTIKGGTFREDLYYRLNVLSLTMPPLRERREDIPLLAGYFALRISKNAGRSVKGISPEARKCLVQYDWPGNVRELENAIERAVVLGTTELIQPEDLPETLLEKEAVPGVQVTEYHQAIKETKRQLVLKAFQEAGGNYAQAARSLGMHPNNLHRLIRNLDLKLPSAKSPSL
jgi:transcriptional regulator with GAF, ATPase, and Fis domain